MADKHLQLAIMRALSHIAANDMLKAEGRRLTDVSGAERADRANRLLADNHTAFAVAAAAGIAAIDRCRT